jgi:hypothetical protein
MRYISQKVLKHEQIKTFFGAKADYVKTQSVLDCSESLKIHPCLIIGALAHLKKITYNRLHEFNEDPLIKIPQKYHLEQQLHKA